MIYKCLLYIPNWLSYIDFSLIVLSWVTELSTIKSDFLVSYSVSLFEHSGLNILALRFNVIVVDWRFMFSSFSLSEKNKIELI